VIRLSEIHPALQRRLVRHAAEQLGAAPDFAATEALRNLARSGRAGQKLELAQGLRAERTHRELRLTSGPNPASKADATKNRSFDSVVAVPGEVEAPNFGLRLQIEVAESSIAGHLPKTARLRPWKPGDRVHVRHSGSPRKVKEVLERLKVTGSDRERWPVLEFDGRIIWMKGIELNPEPGIRVVAIPLNPEDIGPTGSNTVARASL
jgi:tRNA(Ile)-lysidine synthase